MTVTARGVAEGGCQWWLSSLVLWVDYQGGQPGLVSHCACGWLLQTVVAYNCGLCRWSQILVVCGFLWWWLCAVVTDVDCVRSSLFVVLCGGNHNIWWLLMETHYDGCM